MADGKWMFGATSKADLNEDLNPKKTYLNRDLPTEYSEGGMNIGQSGENTRRTGAAAYKAQLDMDRSNCTSDGLPDARRRNAYDLETRSPRARPTESEDHPLGRSSMGALGAPSSYVKPSPSKSAQAQERRDELQKNRFDIITTIEKEGLTENTPAARNDLDLLIGVPLSGRKDDGFLEIGASSQQENSVKKQKALDYAAALRADQDNFGSNRPVNKYATGDRGGYNNMYTHPSQAAINTGIASLSGVGPGPSLDMSQSMKQISFDVKREKQAAYRAQLANQQATTQAFKNVEAEKNVMGIFEDLPYLSSKNK